MRFFSRKSLFRESLQEKKESLHSIMEKSRMDGDYYLLLVLSSIIITLGLLIRNDIVIIGGAFIAPLLSPVLSLSIGIVTLHLGAIWRSIKILIKSMGLVFMVSYATSFLFYYFEDSYVALPDVDRSHFIFFVIALVAGIGVSFSWAKPKMFSTLPDVAVVVSLLPAIVTISIGLAYSDLHTIVESSKIFGLNFVGITFASVAVFTLLGFSRVRKEEAKILQKEKQQLED